MANNNQVNQTVENYDMAYASMAALQQQEELERDAYNRGDMTAAYSADTYQDAINLPASYCDDVRTSVRDDAREWHGKRCVAE